MVRRISARVASGLFICTLMVVPMVIQRDSHAQQPAPPVSGQTNFTGVTSSLETTGLLAGRRRFEAGARSAWHTHPGGQLLWVEQGRARVQRKGEPIRDFGALESDFTGPEVPHWHGATPDQSAVQASLSFGGLGKWLDKVTDAEYLGRAK